MHSRHAETPHDLQILLMSMQMTLHRMITQKRYLIPEEVILHLRFRVFSRPAGSPHGQLLGGDVRLYGQQNRDVEEHSLMLAGL